MKYKCIFFIILKNILIKLLIHKKNLRITLLNFTLKKTLNVLNICNLKIIVLRMFFIKKYFNKIINI